MADSSNPQTFQLALQHHQAGRLPEAEALYRDILARDQNCVDALHHLGIIAHQVGRYAVAAELIGRAAGLAPNHPAIHSNLGEAYRHLDRLDEAIASFQRALALQPDFPNALDNLGNALATQGRNNEAIDCYRRAIALQPGFANAFNNLGDVLKESGQLDAAFACFQKAIDLRPDFAEAHNNLGRAFQDRDQLDEALACFRQALTLKPDLVEAHNNLGGIFKDRGQLHETIACYQRALELDPDRPDIHSNLVLALHYLSDGEASTLDAELRRWNQRHARPLAKFIPTYDNERSPARRLRIGYLSPDFRSHPVGWFMRPLLAAHDRHATELFCYSDAPRVDVITAQIRSHVDAWRDIVGQTDQQVADQIRVDRVDILVDLALHTARNRLLVLARKPAPVQATYLAYPGYSGLDTVDYRLTDPHLDPSDDCVATGPERPIRLPETYWCYQPLVEPSPEVTPLPALTAGHITFGCLNNFGKVTPVTLAIWCRLLAAVPEAHLLLHTHPGSHRRRLRELFARNNLDPQRLEFADHVPIAQYFRCYQSIDIALDPFPFPGGTTTCDALWMGVPVITLAGPTPVSRGGVSLLSNIGLSELAAQSVDEYVAIAATLARDLPRLAALRAGLRERMQRSPLMDAPRFARNLEAAYRSMWHRWCGQSEPASDSPR